MELSLWSKSESPRVSGHCRAANALNSVSDVSPSTFCDEVIYELELCAKISKIFVRLTLLNI